MSDIQGPAIVRREIAEIVDASRWKISIPVVVVLVAAENDEGSKQDGAKEEVRLYEDDYKRLAAMQVSPSWYTNRKKNGRLLVCFKSKRRNNNSVIARCILGLWPDEDADKYVTYRDDSTFNLQRHNLEVRIRKRAVASPPNDELDLEQEEEAAPA